jgi:hypothetical protein
MTALLKREEFAISLRVSKKRNLLKLKRRKNIEFYSKGVAMDDIELRLRLK